MAAAYLKNKTGLYTNTNTPDAAHQLDAEAVAAQVIYTRTNTKSCFWGGGKSDRVPNTFRGAMGLLQAARWKTTSDKEIASLEEFGVFNLVPIPLGKKGDITISQKDYTEDAIQRCGMEGCNSAYILEVGPELPLNQPEENLLNEEEKRRYQGITGAVYVFCTSRYLPASTDVSITYKQGSFRLVDVSDANWGNNPGSGWSTSSYIMMKANAPIGFKVGLQGLTVQSTMEAELVAEALAMKEAVFCPNMILKLGFGESFVSVPLYIDNTLALHIAGNRTYSPRLKHIALRYYFVEIITGGRE